MGIRFTLLIGGVFVAYGALLFHVYGLQIAKGDYYLARASSQVEAGDALNAPRGVIYFTDKNGNKTPVALNKDFPVVYAVPKAITDVNAAVKALSPLVSMPEAELSKRLSSQSSYALIEKKASSTTAGAVGQLNIKGIYVQSLPFRYYPLKDTASQLLGFVGPSANDVMDHGRYGLESFYDTQLAGDPGVMKDGKIEFPHPGGDLQLTIDPNIQVEAEKLIQGLVHQFGAPDGSIIVEDPNTGKILALANSPNFDPNNYQQSSVGTFLDPVAQTIYEPGSVVKVLTMAAGIDSGKITPETHFYDSGSLTLNGHTIKNWDLKAHGDVTMTNVIEHSLNTGAAFAERQTGNDIFKSYIQKFGFGTETGVDLPGELSGDLSQLMKPDAPPVEFATASFGQGIAATPMQVINAISALANGGNLMRPYLNADMQPKVVHRVISTDTAHKVTQMMVTAVNTNIVAHIDGYNVAGKTGTAQLANASGGGYGDKVVNTYVGYAPASAPKFVVLVKLDQPPGSPLAGQTIVPAFREMVQYLLNYYEIPPDKKGDTVF
jgi:cell division protein FtsI/penicillin-binding protein 2